MIEDALPTIILSLVIASC